MSTGGGEDEVMSTINITPFTDVLLVLLIIFMAASIRVRLTIDGNLAIPCAAVCEGTESIVLEVLPGPTYKINKTPVPAEALRAQLASIFAARPDKIIQVAGHAGVKYQDVINAMDIAKSSGVLVIGIAPKEAY